ncbi:fluoride efflux transporter CrcB [Secundilactobacillus malefermentans]|uniref:Fluoride-specific ion channel FluC n=1 Tax=Secundilactobacillus malefermentans TaxID=176292 RepID=A0A4R5NL39_9LACO|nr:fluoride efflux transporter CrcB [Secundilactobacillus malefermentans]KRM59506.1 protein CrcB [Secundilactobacillus malefermentans DSM 5705 = KCTC 3548]QEA31862.1 fluoride efflux transporter CrcB [Secundilactobacillus malefermentans]TDG75410.1 hypothetical protein C5L31_000284 [Secundilactobacillus malefermentans]
MMIPFVALGAGVGAVVRYELTRFFKLMWRTYFPLGTLIINVIACFSLGIFMTMSHGDGTFYGLLGIGFCGGMSTFSTMAFETIGLIKERWVKMAVLYVVGSVVLGLMAVGLGMMLG